MGIKEDLEFARHDYLQEEWDKFLLDSWRNAPNTTMSKIVYSFSSKNLLKDDEIFTFNRTPKYKIHFRCRIHRYMAAFLPKISELLFSGLPDEKILPVLAKSNRLITPSDTYKKRVEIKLIKDSNKDNQKTIFNLKAFNGQHLSSLRSNWKACK